MALDWKLLTVLPNLPLTTVWEFEPFAFVPSDDARLHGIRRSNPAARALLDNFRDAFGRKREPAALIVLADANTRIKWDDVVDLRNAFAISCICSAWQKTIGSKNPRSLLYSDYFDFYPFTPHRDGEGLVLLGFALRSYDDPNEFNGQPHADLPGAAWNFGAKPDEQLLNALIARWRKRNALKRRSWRSDALFRSLAVAFRAARLPKGCDNELFDLGIQLSLWVSANECLAHPGAKEQVSLSEVLALLGKRLWLYASLRKKSKLKAIKTPVNYIQKLYVRMYWSRNAFLHGNPVKSDQIFIGKTKTDSLFVKVAPLVYQAALEAVLIPQRPRGFATRRERLLYVYAHAHMERALEKTRHLRP
jgi:hypothetical protein